MRRTRTLKIKLGPDTDVPEGEGMVYSAAETEILVLRHQGQYYAINNICPHLGASLAEGWLEDTVITCPLHEWSFDIRTGRSPENILHQADCYRLAVENGIIYLLIDN